MGPNKFQNIIILMMFCLFSFSSMSFSCSRDSLDNFIHKRSRDQISMPRTGILYEISLPANFSGVKALFTRIRSGSLWKRGANFGVFRIPPMFFPMPFVKRLDIVYQNLGNRSSYYYNVPNYTLVTPIFGLLTYDSNSSASRYGNLTFLSMGDPIFIDFSQFLSQKWTNSTMKCVGFRDEGSIGLRDMSRREIGCHARGPGHYALVVPSEAMERWRRRQRHRWWVVGFGAGVGGLVVVGAVATVTVKVVRRRRIGKMERESERSEGLGSVWVGNSRMPSASVMRTQPMLENEYVA